MSLETFNPASIVSAILLQIAPEHPRRWLLIKHEMEVPDAVSGAARWSIDFLFIDQDAVFTFVECKRHDDTRSRREVIAQVLEYAANAPRLWRSEDLRRAAEITQRKQGLTLEEVVKRCRIERIARRVPG